MNSWKSEVVGGIEAMYHKSATTVNLTKIDSVFD